MYDKESYVLDATLRNKSEKILVDVGRAGANDTRFTLLSASVCANLHVPFSSPIGGSQGLGVGYMNLDAGSRRGLAGRHFQTIQGFTLLPILVLILIR